METSITSETISQQTICGEPEHLSKDCELIEIANDNEPKQAQSKEQMTEIEQTRKNLIKAWQVYFNYLLPQKMVCTKHCVKHRAQKTATVTTGKVLWVKQPPQPKKRWFCPGTKDLCEIHKFQKSMELLIPKLAFWRLV